MKEIVELERGAVLFREGEQGDCAFIIEKGALKITTDTNGSPYLLRIAKAGEIIGEMAVIDDSPRSATVTVARDVRLRVIHKDQLRSRLEQADPVVYLMMRVITDRFRSSVKVLAGIQAPDAPVSNAEIDMTVETVIDKFRLEAELRYAIRNQELQVFYQPIIDLKRGGCAGFEALVRWPHKERGFISPEIFVSLSEETGLIRELGNFVVDRSIRDLRRLTDEIDRMARLYVGINVSQQQLSDTAFLDYVSELAASVRLDPKQVKLELTESRLAGDADTAAWIQQAKSKGFSVLLDDFGTGYSSLSQLLDLEIDVVKIDQSFVRNMGTSDKALSMVRAIVAMALALGMEIVAEGIETDEQREALANMGCHLGQGYGLGKPMAFDDFAAFLGTKAARESMT